MEKEKQKNSFRIGKKPLKTTLVKDAVLVDIRKGFLKPGDKLASLNDISRTLEISPSAVYRALQSLANEGMLECQGTRGFFVRRTSEKKNMEPASETIPSAHGPARRGPEKEDARIFLSLGHHCDLVWKHPYEDYRKIQEKQFDRMLERFSVKSGIHAYVEQACLLENYLKKHPERKREFIEAFRKGLLSPMGGYCIPDLNMSSGELLVRNLQLGRKIYREILGEEPEIACENDAFGMHGQMPQILKKAGYRFLFPGRLPGLSHPKNKPFRWIGQDGSSIPVIQNSCGISFGCFECNWPILHTPTETMRETLQSVVQDESGEDLLILGVTEEGVFPDSLFSIIDMMNREESGRRVEFGSPEAYAARIDEDGLENVCGEFNPVFTGCYTTRSAAKQRFHALENRIFALEMLAVLSGTKPSFDSAWRLLMECSFHDALCGCVSDKAQKSIDEKLSEAEALLENEGKKLAALQPSGTLFNPAHGGTGLFTLRTDRRLSFLEAETQWENGILYGISDLPDFGTVRLSAREEICPESAEASPVFETDFFAVDFSTPSPVIRDKRLDRVLSPSGMQFGEILIRQESGSMWTENIESAYNGRECTEEKVVSVRNGPVFTSIVTEGTFSRVPEKYALSGFRSLSFRKEYRFFRKLDYFTLHVKLEYHGVNTKISIRFPVDLNPAEAQGLFGIPFGSAVRYPYNEVMKKYESTLRMLPQSDYANAAGDFPAYDRIDYSDPCFGLAAAHRGTFGWQAVNGFLYASLLRSGTRQADGIIMVDPGAWENGIREYDFAFSSHAGMEQAVSLRTSEALNHPPVLFMETCGDGVRQNGTGSLCSFDKENITVSSIRPDGDGWILRVFEALNEETDVRIHCPGCVMLESDLQEKTWNPVAEGPVRFAPFEIKTFKILQRK